MSDATTREKLPCVSRHTLVMTLLEGPDHYNGHCICDRWSYRTADWTDLGTKWAWHYIAESERPDDHPLIRKTVKAELEAIDNYGGDCAGCGTPVVKGRTYCRTCEETESDHGDNCERNCCWEDTVARRVARDAAHQTDPCPDCGNCRTCDDPRLSRPRGLHLSSLGRGGPVVTATEHTEVLLEALRRNLHVLNELAVRYEVETDPGRADEASAITCPEDVHRLLGAEMGTLCQEQVRVLLLDRRNRVVGQRVIYQGNAFSSVVRPAEVLRPAVVEGVPHLIVAHNHPSGDPSPSPQDVKVTRELQEAAKLLGLELLDHVVIGGDGAVSLKDRGLL